MIARGLSGPGHMTVEVIKAPLYWSRKLKCKFECILNYLSKIKLFFAKLDEWLVSISISNFEKREKERERNNSKMLNL